MEVTIAAYVFYTLVIAFFSLILYVSVGVKMGWLSFESLEPDGMDIVTTRDMEATIMEVKPGADLRDTLIAARFKVVRIDNEFIKVDTDMAEFHVFADSDIDRLMGLYEDLKAESIEDD